MADSADFRLLIQARELSTLCVSDTAVLKFAVSALVRHAWSSWIMESSVHEMSEICHPWTVHWIRAFTEASETKASRPFASEVRVVSSLYQQVHHQENRPNTVCPPLYRVPPTHRITNHDKPQISSHTFAYFDTHSAPRGAATSKCVRTLLLGSLRTHPSAPLHEAKQHTQNSPSKLVWPGFNP